MLHPDSNLTLHLIADLPGPYIAPSNAYLSTNADSMDIESMASSPR